MISKVPGAGQFLKYVVPAVLPVVGAGAGFIASSHAAPVRVYWILVALAAVLGAGVINAFKTYRADSASRDAVTARANLATAFTAAGQPLVTAVADVVANNGALRDSKLDTLKSRCLQVARSQCGRMAKERPNIRASLYALEGDTMTREMSEGRSSTPPRPKIGTETRKDVALIHLAMGESTLLEPDTAAPNATGYQFDDAVTQSYRGFIAVPIRAANKNFGLLVVDSDVPDSLTEVDAGYVQLLAGLIACGVAHGGRGQ
jgi:hypothetical protein